MEENKKFLNLNKRQVFNIFFVSILLILLYHLVRIFSPFIAPIFLAISFAIIFHPLNFFLRKKDFNPSLAAGLTTMSVFLTVIIPMLLFGWLLFKETRDIYPRTVAYLNQNTGINLTIRLPKILPVSEFDLKEIALKNVEDIQDKIIKSGTRILRNIFFIIVDFFVMIITLFFIFRDGDKLLKWIIEITPMDPDHKYRILNQFYLTVIAVVKGLLLTAAIQGMAGGIGYYIAGAPSPVLLGMFTSFSAIIPFIGTSTVWIPLSLGMFIFESHISGIFIFLWGSLVVGLLDNVLRPILIGREAKLPVFLLFIGIFGGLRIYGPLGLFIGPILISMVMTFLQIYGEHIAKTKFN